MVKGVERKQKHPQACVMGREGSSTLLTRRQGLGTAKLDGYTSSLHAGEENKFSKRCFFAIKLQQSWWFVTGMKGWAGRTGLASHTRPVPWHIHLQHCNTTHLPPRIGRLHQLHHTPLR